MRLRAGVTVTVLAAVLAFGGCSDDDPPPVTAPPTAEATTGTTTASPPSEPVDPAVPQVQGTERWLAPSPAEEAGLPPVRTHFPPVIDLAADVPDAEADPLRVARAAFLVPGTDRVLLVEDEDQRLLDVSGLEPVRGPGGRMIDAVSDRMLSPTGQYLLFAQTDHLMAFDVAAGRWLRLDEPSGTTGERISWLRAGDTFAAGGWGVPTQIHRQGGLYLPGLGPQMSSLMTHWTGPATSYGIAMHGYAMDPPEVAEATGEPTRTGGTILVEPLLSDRQRLVLAGEGRAAGCCPMVGFNANEVFYASSGGGGSRLLRWVPGTEEFGVVTRVTGLPGDASYVASWAAAALP